MGKCHLLNNKFTIVQEADVSETLSRRLIIPRHLNCGIVQSGVYMRKNQRRKDIFNNGEADSLQGNLEMTVYFAKKRNTWR